MRQIYVGAHRGAMCYEPENTLAAFETAIRQGTYRIELDERRATDGTGTVAAKSLGELRALRVGRAERIPTLSETLEQARAAGSWW